MSTIINVRRKGVVLIFVLVLFVCMVGVMALAVDVGYLYNVKGELQAAVDAAALAGASALSIDQNTARDRAIEYAQKNNADGQGVILQGSDVQLGLWDSVTGFTPLDSSASRASAIKVSAYLAQERGSNVGLFFASVFGSNSAEVSTSAIAVFGARDIVLTLDYSASMSYDSQLRHIDDIGQAEVEGYLELIWQELLQQLDSPLHTLEGTGMSSALVYISSTDDNVIKNTLGLNGIDYPYPPRTWSDYFDYVQGSYNPYNEGKSVPYSHRKRYGYLTMMNYLQAVQYRLARDNVPLWQTSHQPMKTVKNAVTVFLAYMNQERTDDRIGLASYTSSDGNGTLEVPLTDDYNLIEETVQRRQAGHYHSSTNIAGGIESALNEMRTRGRVGALRLVVLLSDGKANYPDGTYIATNAALEQAQQAANDNIPILTISLGADADLDLMQDIADITGGIHFIVPGGDDVADYEEPLFDIFTEIVGHRPLRLVD